MFAYALAYTLAMVILCTGLHACNGYPMHWLTRLQKSRLIAQKLSK